MSETIAFPSRQFPAVPEISLTLPPAWSGAVVPATLLAARRSVEVGQFASNVIVRSQRVGADADLQAAAAVVDEGIARLAEVEHIGRWLIETDGRQAYCREFAFRHPVAGTLAQVWRVFRVEHDAVADLIELIGTVSPQRTGDLAEVRAMMDSAVVREPVPVGQL